MFKELLVQEGSKVKLSKIETDYKGKMDKEDLIRETEKNIGKIEELQNRLYAEGKQSLLLILQAIDAGGKDGTIRKVFSGVNPQGCRVTSFKAPTKKELAHDFLWRVHREAPEDGMITIFNRSHYEDVLIVRVHDWINDKECQKRYGYINDFEKMLSHFGTRIVKIFLYISKDEQKKRLQERIDDKDKNWKFASEDLPERGLWDKYISQFEEVFENTSTEQAPWFIVPANNKKYRDYAVSAIVRKTLEDMDPQFPPAAEGIEKIKVK